MAWLDDRVWCHDKIINISDKAFRVWVNGITYSSGMGTKGQLTPAHQKLIGSTPKIKAELFKAELWDANGDSGVVIHDWDEHNGKRDERRAKDRERKRKMREQQFGGGKSVSLSAGQTADSPQELPVDVPQARRTLTDDGRRVTVIQDPVPEPSPEASYVDDPDREADLEPTTHHHRNGAGAGTGELERLDTEQVLAQLAAKLTGEPEAVPVADDDIPF